VRIEEGMLHLRAYPRDVERWRYGILSHNSPVIMIADVRHHRQVAPITNGSRKVR
jgi:hypothetical protein